MRIRRISNWLFLALAVSLHLALLASAYLWYAQAPVKRSLPSLAVSVIIPAAPVLVAPPAPAPVQIPAPQKPLKRPKTQAKPPVKPKPAPKQAARASKTAEALPPSPIITNAPVTKSEPIAEPAPVAPSASAAPTPVKTSVSVNASYVATQTEKWYPSLSKRYGEQGTVVVRVHVSPDGQAEKVELKKRSDYPLLDEAAIGLAKSLKYNPARVDDNPVADWVEIPITFRLR